jgi:hypothetical protein
MPDTARPVNRLPSDSSQDSIKALVSMSPGLTTRHQWFTYVRLLGPYLPYLVRLFHDAHHHSSFTAAARGGLTPTPVRRCRRAYLHLHNSATTENFVFYIEPLIHLQDTLMQWPNRSSLRSRMNGSIVPNTLPASAHVTTSHGILNCGIILDVATQDSTTGPRYRSTTSMRIGSS